VIGVVFVQDPREQQNLPAKIENENVSRKSFQEPNSNSAETSRDSSSARGDPPKRSENATLSDSSDDSKLPISNIVKRNLPDDLGENTHEDLLVLPTDNSGVVEDVSFEISSHEHVSSKTTTSLAEEGDSKFALGNLKSTDVPAETNPTDTDSLNSRNFPRAATQENTPNVALIDQDSSKSAADLPTTGETSSKPAHVDPLKPTETPVKEDSSESLLIGSLKSKHPIAEDVSEDTLIIGDSVDSTDTVVEEDSLDVSLIDENSSKPITTFTKEDDHSKSTETHEESLKSTSVKEDSTKSESVLPTVTPINKESSKIVAVDNPLIESPSTPSRPNASDVAYSSGEDVLNVQPSTSGPQTSSQAIVSNTDSPTVRATASLSSPRVDQLQRSSKSKVRKKLRPVHAHPDLTAKFIPPETVPSQTILSRTDSVHFSPCDDIVSEVCRPQSLKSQGPEETPTPPPPATVHPECFQSMETVESFVLMNSLPVSSKDNDRRGFNDEHNNSSKCVCLT
jgi:hypothetical protein